MRKISHSYFVTMVDRGQRGLEAIVHPEDTRRDVIEMIASGETQHVVFVHHIADGLAEDVTGDLLDEAERLSHELAFNRLYKQAAE